MKTIRTLFTAATVCAASLAALTSNPADATGYRAYQWPGGSGFFSVAGDFYYNGSSVSFANYAACVNNHPSGEGVNDQASGAYHPGGNTGTLQFYCNYQVFSSNYADVFYCYPRFNAYANGSVSGFWGSGTSAQCKVY